ncbi:hypothetical protein [uncultured Piscinibacter sp.]|uniref:hypothetical protein n=1 Tax=uncultured Piscinibacter sp. TaxID=1131835 RepID=UPI0026283CB6|nr:hypothetical protein [uncultured Piscinibacter sp.]
MAIQDYLSMGNRAMALSGAAMLLGIGAAYPFAHHLGLVLQIVAHLSIAIAAGVFKLGYVIRLAAQHELVQPVAPAGPQARVPQAKAGPCGAMDMGG